MSSLNAWVWAGLKSPLRVVFMLLLIFAGAIGLGELVMPLRDKVLNLCRRESAESREVRLELQRLQHLARQAERPVTQKMGEFSAAIERRLRLTQIRQQLVELKNADMKDLKKAEAAKLAADQDNKPEADKWKALIDYYDNEIHETDRSTKDVAEVLEGKHDVQMAVRNLDKLTKVANGK